MNYSRYLCYYFKYEIFVRNEEDGVNYGYHFWIILVLLPVFWLSGLCRAKTAAGLSSLSFWGSLVRLSVVGSARFGFGKVDGFNFGTLSWR